MQICIIEKKGRSHGQQSILERSRSSNGLALFRNGRHRSSTNRVTLLFFFFTEDLEKVIVNNWRAQIAKFANNIPLGPDSGLVYSVPGQLHMAWRRDVKQDFVQLKSNEKRNNVTYRRTPNRKKY